MLSVYKAKANPLARSLCAVGNRVDDSQHSCFLGSRPVNGYDNLDVTNGGGLCIF